MNGERGARSRGGGGLVRELEVQRLRTAVAVEVSPRLWEYFDQVAPIATVVATIVDRWTTGTTTMPLTGPDGYTGAYVATVEQDATGRPWWQFCRRGADRRLVADESYPRRVWTHHAGWLQRIDATAPTTVPDPLPDGPAGEVVVARLRTEATIEMAPAVPEWLSHDPALLGAVVADVVDAWLTLPSHERAKVALTGRRQFVERYVGSVLYEREDPDGEVYRPEFCPPDAQTLDMPAYERAAWAHHITQLAGAR